MSDLLAADPRIQRSAAERLADSDAGGRVVDAAGAPPAPGLIRPRAVRSRGHGRAASIVIRSFLPLTLFALWWWGTESGWISASVLASPSVVVDTFRELVEEDNLFGQLGTSLSLSLRGALLGGTLGLLLGSIAGLWRIGEELLDALLQMLRTIPFLGVVPLFVVWLGIDDRPKVLLIALATLFPMYLNTYNGVRNVDRKVVEAMNVFGLKGPKLVARVVIPLALPSILTGVRYCLGISVLALIAAEQINSSKGLGYLMYQAQSLQQIEILVVVLAIYAVLGLLADLIVRVLERLLMPWRGSLANR